MSPPSTPLLHAASLVLEVGVEPTAPKAPGLSRLRLPIPPLQLVFGEGVEPSVPEGRGPQPRVYADSTTRTHGRGDRSRTCKPPGLSWRGLPVASPLLVPRVGVEPTRRRHRGLKPACLPVPPSRLVRPGGIEPAVTRLKAWWPIHWPTAAGRLGRIRTYDALLVRQALWTRLSYEPWRYYGESNPGHDIDSVACCHYTIVPLVDAAGLEPATPVCKTGVFPVTPRPHW